jgi:hypothetical protein
MLAPVAEVTIEQEIVRFDGQTHRTRLIRIGCLSILDDCAVYVGDSPDLLFATPAI